VTRDIDVLAVGEINPDLILSDYDLAPVFGQTEKLIAHADLRIGSSSAIFACGTARLGLRTAFVGVVGADLFGTYMLRSMSECGIDVSRCIVDPQVRTGLSVILTRGHDRAILTYPGSIGALRATQVPLPLIQSARHLHVGSYFLLDQIRQDIPTLFNAAHEAGTTTSLDCNWDPRDTWQGGLAQALLTTDMFFLNAEEARRISGTTDVLAAGRRLAKQGPVEVIVKRGAEGALCVTGDRVSVVEASPVNVIDTVGAGDSFDAGYVCGKLLGKSAEEALMLAVTCGSLSTEGRGGTEAQATLDQALATISAAAADRSQDASR
jgi:sugar/nucleoside kinase (ribokinase family)